jgi:glycosyltransferase involved in cell wall biosynthesis
LLFVSHEATRTGAPLIILNVLRHFAENTIAACDTILHSGGHLAQAYCRFGRAECLNLPRKSTDELTKRIRKFVLKSDRPALAVCNSMESRFVAYELEKLGIPIIFLVHELPSSYSVEDYMSVVRCATHLVFPAEAVRAATGERIALPPARVSVLPQGLLNPQFGLSIPGDQARVQIRRELHLPDDAYVVLGCGTLDLRKGIDHFASIARVALTQGRFERPLHFVWVGEGPRWTHSPYHYVQLDVEKSAARGHVHFIGERENVEPYFLGSDVFLLTSRVDPFPCVVHEAMAAGLPIITFASSGGAAEAVANGTGVVVPYGDYQQVINTIMLLARQPELANNMGQRLRDRVATHYQFSTYGDRIVELAETIAQRPLRRDPRPVQEPLRRAA